MGKIDKPKVTAYNSARCYVCQPACNALLSNAGRELKPSIKKLMERLIIFKKFF